jgi:hypothetical protein
MLLRTRASVVIHPREREGFVMWRAKVTSVDFCPEPFLDDHVFEWS